MKDSAASDEAGKDPEPSIIDATAQPAAKKRTPKRKDRNVKNFMESEEYFGRQFNSSKDLPNPTDSLALLATGVIEVIAGTRQIEQLSRYLTDSVYQSLQSKARQAQQYREENGIKAHHQKFSVGPMRQESPRDGVVESVVILNGVKRNRAVTIRLEGINHRWRATALSVL